MKTRYLAVGVLGVMALAGCGAATANVNATPEATAAPSVSTAAVTSAPAKTTVPTTAKRRPPARTTVPTTAKRRPPATAPAAVVPTTAAPTTTPRAPTTAAPPRAATVPAVVVTRVIDGDTIVIDTGQHVRLIGIDTPESGHCGYDEATTNMRGLVFGKGVILTAGARDDVDRYGRLLRYVDLPDGTDAGLAQIKGGFAIARYDSRDGYGHHPRQETYIAADTGAAAHCIVTAPTSAPAAQGSSVYYPNCAAARAAGVAPLHTNDPGYRSGLDGDHDGVACE